MQEFNSDIESTLEMGMVDGVVGSVCDRRVRKVRAESISVQRAGMDRIATTNTRTLIRNANHFIANNRYSYFGQNKFAISQICEKWQFSEDARCTL